MVLKVVYPLVVFHAHCVLLWRKLFVDGVDLDEAELEGFDYLFEVALEIEHFGLGNGGDLGFDFIEDFVHVLSIRPHYLYPLLRRVEEARLVDVQSHL